MAMNEYTTFHKVLDYLQYYQEQSPLLNTYGYGNLVDFGKNISGNSVNYPFLFVVPQSIEYQENMGIKYIVHRYDTPSKAWAFWQRNGWY